MDLVSRVQRLPIGKFHYTLLWVIGLGWMFDAMDTGLISFILAKMAEDWAMSPAEKGWVVSIGFVGMAIGAVLQTLMMIPMNLIFTVHFFGVPREAVVALLPTAIIPFNAIKTVANSIITFLLYKRVAKLLERDFVKPKTLPNG